MVQSFVVILALAVLYWFPIRRWMSRWGATPADLKRVMAGDAWLVQIGYQRGGLYSYDWLDRLFGFLDRPSATRILPEFQHLAVGDRIPLGRGPSWPVAVLDPRRALVLDMRNLSGFDWVWQFGLYPIDERRTRLVSRSLVHPLGVASWLVSVLAIEPSGFIMTRRMLLGLKERAEALGAARARHDSHRPHAAA
jgi:hypothetical protein